MIVGQAAFSNDVQPVFPLSFPQPPGGAPGKRFARPPRVSLPIPPTYRRVHSRASQLLARSSLSCELGLGLDLQVQWDQFAVKAIDLDASIDYMKNRVPLLLQRKPAEPLSKLMGFFPATIKPYRVRPYPSILPEVVSPGGHSLHIPSPFTVKPLCSTLTQGPSLPGTYRVKA